MIVEITLRCESSQTEHPILIDITDWKQWKVIDSTCIRKYGWLFGLMQSCAQQIKSPPIPIQRKIIEQLGTQVKQDDKILAKLKEITENSEISDLVKEAIQSITYAEEKAIPILKELLASTNRQAQGYASSAIQSLQKTGFKIPKDIDITAKIIQLSYERDRNKLQKLLDTVVQEKILLASNAIFLHIENSNPDNDLCINAIIKLQTPSIETLREYLKSNNIHLIEKALFVLEQYNPPDILDLAYQHTYLPIARKILKNKSTEQDLDKLIQLLFNTKNYQVIFTICEIFTEQKNKNAIPHLLRYIQHNRITTKPIPEEIYIAIIKIEEEKYRQNPEKIITELNPNKNELEEIAAKIARDKTIDETTRKQILQGLIQYLKENPSKYYNTTTTQQIITLLEALLEALQSEQRGGRK